MATETDREEIERLKYEIDILKSKQETEVPLVEDGDGEEETPVEAEDPTSDDPDGELAATAAALRSEVARMREIQELRGKKQELIEGILRKQGYKI